MDTGKNSSGTTELFLVPDGCNRNATTKLIKTANIAGDTVLTHVAENRQHRLRPGIFNRATISTNFLKLLLVIMTLGLFVPEQHVEAGSIHRKRSHSTTEITTTERYFTQNEKNLLHEICAMEIKWNTACRGEYENKTTTETHRPSLSVVLTPLKKLIADRFPELKTNTSEIDITDTNETWSAHKKNYEFLPRITRNEIKQMKVRLRAWHRKAQIYVASFDMLYRAQLRFDLKKHHEEGPLARVLKKFEAAALALQCEIESAFNLTNKGNHTVKFFKLARMKKEMLNFRTKTKYFYTDNTSDTNNTCAEQIMDDTEEPTPANSIDLRFLKKQFLGFMRAIRKIVKRKIRSQTSLSRSSSSNSNSSSGSNISRSRSDTNKSMSDISISASSLSEDIKIGRNASGRRGSRRHHKKLI